MKLHIFLFLWINNETEELKFFLSVFPVLYPDVYFVIISSNPFGLLEMFNTIQQINEKKELLFRWTCNIGSFTIF